MYTEAGLLVGTLSEPTASATADAASAEAEHERAESQLDVRL